MELADVHGNKGGRGNIVIVATMFSKNWLKECIMRFILYGRPACEALLGQVFKWLPKGKAH